MDESPLDFDDYTLRIDEVMADRGIKIKTDLAADIVLQKNQNNLKYSKRLVPVRFQSLEHILEIQKCDWLH